VLETHERGATAVDDELSGVRGTDSHHEYDVNVGVVLEQCTTLLFGGSCERHYVCSLEHRAQIGAICQRSELHYVSKVRAVRVENVVVPISLEEASVSFEVAVIGCDAISAIKYGKKVR
jgi:hypothetical protein